jgi:hypothetical protein
MTKRHDLQQLKEKASIEFDGFSFGSVRINGKSYEHDVVIDRGKIRKRDKKPSKKFRATYGHTPLSVEEEIRVTTRNGK